MTRRRGHRPARGARPVRAHRPTRFAALALLLAALACRAPTLASPDAAPESPTPAPGRPAEGGDESASANLEGRGILGRSVHGRPLLVSQLPGAGPHVVILATIHGDEFAGTPLVQRLDAELRADPRRAAGRRVSLIPVANPDGFMARRRTNARGVDLNRNFPAANARESVGGTPLSEPESRALHDWLRVARPDLVISIHQPVGVVDWDGPAESIARVMSDASGLPARRLGSRPGSLGSFLGVDRGVPTITLELPRGAERLPPDELWTLYGATLLRAIESAESQRSTFS